MTLSHSRTLFPSSGKAFHVWDIFRHNIADQMFFNGNINGNPVLFARPPLGG